MAARLDPAPLVAATGGNLRELARRLDIDPAVLCRPITAWQADRYATSLELWAPDVWGAAWWDAIDD